MKFRHLACGLGLLVTMSTTPAGADQAAALLEGPTAVHRISLDFAEADWYQILFDAWGNDDFYLSCTFT